jgi:hypothetical protein
MNVEALPDAALGRRVRPIFNVFDTVHNQPSKGLMD